MSDSESQSTPPSRKGFERRWIKNKNYTGPERRSGIDRRRYPPPKEGQRPPQQDRDDGQDSATDRPPAPNSSGTFKPYRP
jgi:hypothetical protein